MKAVVMAGGEGSRLRPLTSRRPKPLAPIANKPVMHHIVDLVRRHGITEIVATLHYLADEIETYFGDGSALGVSMSYVVEDTPLGTAGAVKQAEDQLSDDTFIVISGDAMTDLDISEVVRAHKKARNDVTIALLRVPNPLEFGVVITDENGRITRFLEKPSWGEVFSDTINTGIYVLEPEIFSYMEPRRNYDFSKDLFPRMLHEGKRLGGFVIDSYWADVGNLQQYQQANYDALSGVVQIEPSGVEIAPGVWADSSARIDPTAKITGPVRLGKEVQIGPHVTIEGPACIGDGSMVDSFAQLNRAILWEDVYVGAKSELTDCTIATSTLIKDHVTIGEGVVIGEHCTIGNGAVVRPHLKLWPEKNVSSGSIVSMSLVYGIKWPGSLFGTMGVSGLGNLEITPEFAIKLGQAFGSFLKPGDVAMTSRDTNPASRVMNRCIISGLMSVGVNVLDLRSYPLPLARFATRDGRQGCIHVRVDPTDARSLLFEFVDSKGINIDTGAERKIENLFFREDFRRVGMDAVGMLDFPARALENYTSGFVQALAPQALAKSGFRVAIDYAYGNVASVLPQILSRVGVDTISLNAYFDDNRVRRRSVDRDKALAQLSRIVTTLDTNFGMLMDHDGESFALVDDYGRTIEGYGLLALITLLVVRAGGKRVAVPMMIPQAIEAICKEYGAEVVRARSDRRSLMALAEAQGKDLAFAGSARAEIIFPEFQPAFDGLYGTAKVLELLARENRPLSELVDMLPPWHTASASVTCPWEHKGRVMRTLIDQEKHNRFELFDGLRVRHDDAWVLVLPDSSDPTFNIYAEGPDDNVAQTLVNTMTQRIEQLVNI